MNVKTMFSILCLSFFVASAVAEGALPLLVDFQSNTTETCPLSVQGRKNIQSAINSTLEESVIPLLELRSSCPCGDAGEWRKIAHLDMSDPNQQCPPNWRLIETPKRTCGRPTGSSGCDSAVFPSNGVSYSRVCGRVIGYQRGSPSAFVPSFGGMYEA